MSEPIEFYFDFSSPYGYLICDQIDDFAARNGRTVAWHPILLGVVFKQTGAEPLTEQPLKGEYSKHDWERFARLLGVPYRFPSRFPLPTQSAARLFYWTSELDSEKAKNLARAFYHALFEHDRDISDPEIVCDIAAEQGFPRAEAADALRSEALKQRLKDECARAIERGVFGSPFIIVDGEPFWGADRLWQVKRWIERGGW